MELKPAKRKKFSPSHTFLLFPSGTSEPFTAYFNGFSISVKDPRQIEQLYCMGFFGRGSLSKNAPTFTEPDDDLPEVLLEQQWINRKSFQNEEDGRINNKNESPPEVLASNSVNALLQRACAGSSSSWASLKKQSKSEDGAQKVETHHFWSDSSNSESPNFAGSELNRLVGDILKSKQPRPMTKAREPREVLVVGGSNRPRLEPPAPPPQELLHLSSYEAFFLAGALGKLNVVGLSGNMSVQELWTAFSCLDKDFVRRYVAYHWYRSRGWVVRSGLKYGGDLVLYEKGPPFCHSSYVVRVCPGESAASWDDLLLIQRLVETFNKDIIFCHVLQPGNMSEEELKDPQVISKFSVKEAMVRRWVPNLQRIAR